MANHFLTKARITLGSCLSYGDEGALALDQYVALNRALSAKISPEAAALFAEPLVSRGNAEAAATVSWYTDLEGDGVLLSSLDDEARAPAETILSNVLGQIKPHLGDPDDGRLFAAALHISSNDSIWVVNGQPLILNWGMLEEGSGTDADARKSHYGKTLGKYLPLVAAPPLSTAEQEAFAGSATTSDGGAAMAQTAAVAAGAVAVGAAATSAAANTSEGLDVAGKPALQEHTVTTHDRRISRTAWIPLLLLLILFGAILFWLLMPGTRLFQPAQVSVVRDANAISLTEDVNRSLRERLAILQSAVDGAQCRADGTLLVPGGMTIEGLLPPGPNDAPGSRTEAAPESILAPDPARVAVPDAENSAQLSQPNLLGVLEDRTVLIIATNNGQVTGSGSGFFIGRDSIVTNFHVVEGAQNIYVTNHSLGKLQDSRIVKTMGPFGETGGDFALLKVEGLNHSFYTILQSEASLKLKSVISAGYPGDVLATDAHFAALRAGDANSVPELTVTDGVVNTEQDISTTSKVVVHSAPISQGNSGGPLVDMCGRVVGVNTFVRQGNLRNLNFALSTRGLLAFLQGTGVQPTVVSGSCAPQIYRPTAPASAPAAAAAEASTDAPALTPLE